MEIIKIKDLSFTYPKREKKALLDINLSVNKGEFITLCGKSGCGKTTLLKLLKTAVSPFGELTGSIYFNNSLLSEIDSKEQAQRIGFVMQSPDNQIVTDKVWHELAFGLESLGYSNSKIRARVAEMASFFGIESWFYKNVCELSGGQKQLLNLASVMVMQPDVLILDEPTSQLDPIAASEFLKTLEKINRELGVTIILSEHRLEETFPISDRIIVMDESRIIVDDKPENTGERLKGLNHDMFYALPAPIKIYEGVEGNSSCPITVRDGRVWLEEYVKEHPVSLDFLSIEEEKEKNDTIIEIKDAYFRYEKESPDVIKGLNVKISKGEIFAVVGGNGTGKTTALSLISGLNTPYRGKVLINGKDIEKIPDLYTSFLGVLPQNPQSVFVKKTVHLDLLEALADLNLNDSKKEKYVSDMAKLCKIENLMNYHPYDLSGGEQQRAALCKILLKFPKILLLDEPTKGLDEHFKMEFSDILCSLKELGVTIVMVSHDIEFCARYADRCALFFDGNITSSGGAREFFKSKNFYTTSTNRMARTTIPDAVLYEDVIIALGGNFKAREKFHFDIFKDEYKTAPTEEESKKNFNLKKLFRAAL